MATKEEINNIIENFHMNMPKHFVNKMDRTNAGMGQVLHYLENANAPVAASEIGNFMGVSSARVAVLLRSMEEKGWVERTNNPADARKTMIALSRLGREQLEERHRELREGISAVIDRIGVERLTEFIDTAKEIASIVSEQIGAVCS